MRPTASLLPFGQWVCDKSREILKHRRCFHSVVIRYGRWGFAESRVLLINHPEWFLCCSVRSVGKFSHVLFQAHRALSCLPQISQICTDVFPCIQLSACDRSVLIRRAGGASKPSSRQRSKSKGSVKRPIRAHQ